MRGIAEPPSHHRRPLGRGLFPLTYADSSNDRRCDHRQSHAPGDGEVSLVLGGFFPFVSAVNLAREEESELQQAIQSGKENHSVRCCLSFSGQFTTLFLPIKRKKGGDDLKTFEELDVSCVPKCSDGQKARRFNGTGRPFISDYPLYVRALVSPQHRELFRGNSVNPGFLNAALSIKAKLPPPIPPCCNSCPSRGC